MYSKIVLILVAAVIGGGIYLHNENPQEVNFIVTPEYQFFIPLSALFFVGFASAAILSLLNSLIMEASRGLRDLRIRRDKRVLDQGDSNFSDGLELLYKGDGEGGAKLIEKAMGVESTLERTLRLAECHRESGDPLDALKVLENGLASHPSSVAILNAIGLISLEIDDRLRATKAFDDLLKVDGKNVSGLAALRDIMAENSDWSGAVALQKTLLSVLKGSEGEKEEKKRLAGLLYEVARGAFNDGSFSDAKVGIKDLLKGDNTFVPGLVLYGDILIGEGNPQGAIKFWEKVIDKSAEPVVLMRLEDLYMSLSQPNKALEMYRKACDRVAGQVAGQGEGPDSQLKLLLSRFYLRIEMVDMAIAELERIADEGDDNFYQRILLGEAYVRRNESSKASELFFKAIGADKDLKPPFVCRECGNKEKVWKGACSACQRWGTLEIRPISYIARDMVGASDSPSPEMISHHVTHPAGKVLQ